MSNDTQTLTLTEFLLARIAEDESVARHATSGPWRYDPLKVNSVDGEESVFAGPLGLAAICVASFGPESGQSMIDARHVATHDPARVLAECEAKRRIIGRCASVDYAMPSTHLAHGILAEMASAYANHPDYDESWRP